MNELSNFIDRILNESHTDSGYIVRTGGFTKFFIDYDKAVNCFESFCNNQCFGALKSKKGFLPNMQKTFYCMESLTGETTVEIRTVDQVDLVGTPKTWKSFNETIDDISKDFVSVLNDIYKSSESKNRS